MEQQTKAYEELMTSALKLNTRLDNALEDSQNILDLLNGTNCPDCGTCNRDCDNCENCGTAPRE